MDSMKARHYGPVRPLHTAPSGPYVTPGRREEGLSDVLRGVELGGYDEQIMAWMVRMLDDGTLRTIVSLIERVRGAGMIEAVDAENALPSRSGARR
ncbi:MAG TPA: hypothetical protein VGP31_05490 [Planosporangium sp.]|nr:hypothetical protein [Planosporangium sp.]